MATLRALNLLHFELVKACIASLLEQKVPWPEALKGAAPLPTLLLHLREELKVCSPEIFHFLHITEDHLPISCDDWEEIEAEHGSIECTESGRAARRPHPLQACGASARQEGASWGSAMSDALWGW